MLTSFAKQQLRPYDPVFKLLASKLQYMSQQHCSNRRYFMTSKLKSTNPPLNAESTTETSVNLFLQFDTSDSPVIYIRFSGRLHPILQSSTSDSPGVYIRFSSRLHPILQASTSDSPVVYIRFSSHPHPILRPSTYTCPYNCTNDMFKIIKTSCCQKLFDSRVYTFDATRI